MIPENHLEFLHAVWSRRNPFTLIFLGINVAIFLLMTFAGGTTNEATLLAFGVKSNAEMSQGEIWRFVTPIFIHIGLLHLFFNSYALWIVGPQVEKLYGSARFVILYVLTGVAGVAGSYYYHPETISAGASGAIFGLFGVLLIFGLRYRDSIPPFFKRAVGTGILPVIVINLIIGFTIPQIDNSAHLSGLIAGGMLGVLIPFQHPGGATPSIFKTLQAALLVVVALSFYEVGVHYEGPAFSVRNITDGLTLGFSSGSNVQGFIDTLNNAQKTFEMSADELESGRTDNLAHVASELSGSIDQLMEIPFIAAPADKMASELLRLMQDQYELVQDVERTGRMTFATDQRLKENMDQYARLMDSFFKWVATDGAKYGIATRKGQ